MFKIGSKFGAVLILASASPGLVNACDQFTVTCENSNWIGSLNMKSSRLPATLVRQCKIVLTAPGSIASLNTHLLASIPVDNKVHMGPIPGTYDGLADNLFEVTNDLVEDGLNVEMEDQVQIATDQKTRLIFVSDSSKVTGSGNASYLKVYNDEQDVTLDATDPTGQTFIYKETQYTELEKPWYAPSGIFISQARNGIKLDFDRDSEDNAKLIANKLLD